MSLSMMCLPSSKLDAIRTSVGRLYSGLNICSRISSKRPVSLHVYVKMAQNLLTGVALQVRSSSESAIEPESVRLKRLNDEKAARKAVLKVGKAQLLHTCVPKCSKRATGVNCVLNRVRQRGKQRNKLTQRNWLQRKRH